MKFIFFLTLTLFFVNNAAQSTLEQYWSDMQSIYDHMTNSFDNNICEFESLYIHKYWRNQKIELAKIIKGKKDEKFLLRTPIAGQMVRCGWGKTQEYEITYLLNCLSLKTQNLIKRFRDTTVGGSSINCKQFDCSTNALGQLFYIARILELKNSEEIKTIVEFGGGYGCLCRMSKMIIPNVTYIIFDLPEYLVLQSLFLKMTLPNVEIIVHEKDTKFIQEGAIHLIPIFYLNQSTIKADVFISAFALSEVPSTVQKMVIEKKFFDASLLYIVGQLNGWKNLFEHHSIIFEGVRNSYSFYCCQPFHNFSDDVFSYEIYGKR